MIAYLTGTILEVHEESAVLVCGGVGYEINLPASTAADLTQGTEASFYVAESISPYDGTVLYGFAHKEDKDLWYLFKTAIPNTGPKKALEYLNKALRSVADFHHAIVTRDPKILTSIFGFTAVVEALNALGYSATESRRALERLHAQGVKPTEKLEDIVKEALRVLTK